MWPRNRYTGPGGGLYTGPGGGMYTGPGEYMRNIPPIHIFIRELEKRELFEQARIFRSFGFE